MIFQGKLIEKSCRAKLNGMKSNSLKYGDSFQCYANTPFSKDVVFVERVFVAAEVHLFPPLYVYTFLSSFYMCFFWTGG